MLLRVLPHGLRSSDLRQNLYMAGEPHELYTSALLGAQPLHQQAGSICDRSAIPLLREGPPGQQKSFSHEHQRRQTPEALSKQLLDAIPNASFHSVDVLISLIGEVR